MLKALSKKLGVDMGGMNHQPCREYLALSTRVSRSLSLSHAQLQMANVAFEDILLAELAELAEEVGTTTQVVDYLVASLESLQEGAQALDDLRSAMQDRCYADLPPARTLNLHALGAAFVAQGMVAPGAWRTIQEKTESGGFWAVSDYFCGEVKRLTDLTRALLSGFDALEGACSIGELNVILEENRPGNVKANFAGLYQSWNQFLQEFLASSMLSTHIWYLWTGSETLVETTHLIAVNQ